jgi:hypothetical protein
MIAPPKDPMARQGFVIDALCKGIADGTGFQRVDAIREITRTLKRDEKRANNASSQIR